MSVCVYVSLLKSNIIIISKANNDDIILASIETLFVLQIVQKNILVLKN